MSTFTVRFHSPELGPDDETLHRVSLLRDGATVMQAIAPTRPAALLELNRLMAGAREAVEAAIDAELDRVVRAA